MHPLKSLRTLVFVAIACSWTTRCLADSSPDETPRLENYWILVEPRFLRPELTISIAGGRDTFFVPGREIRDYPGITAYSREEFEKLRLGKEAFYSKASRAAARKLEQITPQIVRDDEGSVLYAFIHLESPLTAGLLIAENFVRKFSPLFGDHMIVMVPERDNLFIFPNDRDIYSQYLVSMAARFEDATYACSRELFLWKAGAEKPIIIGSFAP